MSADGGKIARAGAKSELGAERATRPALEGECSEVGLRRQVAEPALERIVDPAMLAPAPALGDGDSEREDASRARTPISAISSRDPGLDALVPFRFACHRCGNCCSGGQGYVWLAPGETASLARALDISEEAFVARFVRRAMHPRMGEIALALREESNGGDAGGRCVLLEGANRCRAYAARPAHCREFPYWPSVLSDKRAFEAARSTCPGISVEVPPALRDRAFAELERLYADVEASFGATETAREEDCCLVRDGAEQLFATALEADYAAASGARDTIGGCLVGSCRPLGCRLARAAARDSHTRAATEAVSLSRACAAAIDARPSEDDALTLAATEERGARERARFFDRLRRIERELGYPAAYGRFTELMRARASIPHGPICDASASDETSSNVSSSGDRDADARGSARRPA